MTTASAPTRPAPAAGSVSAYSADDTAWRVLEGNQSRIAALDNKAGIVLTLQLGVLTAIAALADTRAQHVGTARATLLAAAIAALAAAVLASIAVIAPRAGVDPVDAEPDRLYFGTLCRLRPREVADLLRGLDLLEELSRLIAHTSQIAWRKHTLLQRSVRLTAAGLALVALFAAAALAA